MKRISLTMIVLLLAAMMLLVSCAGPGETLSDGTSTAPADTTPTDTTAAETTPPVDNTPVTVVDTYLPAAVSEELKSLFESKGATFAVYSTGSAPMQFAMCTVSATVS